MAAVKWLNREKGMTVVLITHHMDEAAEAGRVIVMSDGQIAMDGPPRDIFSKVEEIKALSLAVPQTIELAFRLNREAGAALPLNRMEVGECAALIMDYLGEAQR